MNQNKHILFLFLDGIGLGDDDPAINPFALANTPILHQLSNGEKWVKTLSKQITKRAVFIPTDAQLGIEGRPQSGTSQAAILTGLNVPAITGRHYGPKPDEATREILSQDNFFKFVKRNGKSAILLDAYPPRLLADIERNYTLPSSIQYAAIQSGQPLFSTQDVVEKRALTPEWTGAGWREYLKLEEIPLYTPQEAGQLLVELSRQYDFAMHSHWMTDYVGHRGPLSRGVELLELFDGVMDGILNSWDDDEGLIIITSDHGNMEVIGDRRHTENLVPTVIVGKDAESFADGFTSLIDIVPKMTTYLFNQKAGD